MVGSLLQAAMLMTTGLPRIGHAEIRHRRILEQHLVERVPGGETAGEKTAADSVVGQDQQQRIGDEVQHRFDAGAVEGHELLDDLPIVEFGRVLDQSGGDVVAGFGVLEGNQLGERFDQHRVTARGIVALEHGHDDRLAATTRRASATYALTGHRSQFGGGGCSDGSVGRSHVHGAPGRTRCMGLTCHFLLDGGG
ncbi:hypothetical protein KO481_29780 [Nocardia sp. NEAU-G5]|uniref:Secreted protein n=1 Tax=Nocardia albiluteola TaxID=2842303 RepID=A0ABS6B5V6_9NOCA|nr:hypothetical protein [Nocardia albiluteola]